MKRQGTGGANIVGIGAVTGYGWGVGALWTGLLSGKPAADLVEGYGDAGESAWLARVPAGGERRDGASRSARAMRSAAREALSDAADARLDSWPAGRAAARRGGSGGGGLAAVLRRGGRSTERPRLPGTDAVDPGVDAHAGVRLPRTRDERLGDVRLRQRRADHREDVARHRIRRRRRVHRHRPVADAGERRALRQARRRRRRHRTARRLPAVPARQSRVRRRRGVGQLRAVGASGGRVRTRPCSAGP